MKLTSRVRALLAGLLLALVAACSSGSPSSGPSELIGGGGADGGKYAAFPLTPPRPRPNFTLTDTAGTKFAFGRQTAGHPTLLYFGYTHCPDVCPTTMAAISTALKGVPAPVRQDTYVVFVTTDVKRDSPAVIESVARRSSTPATSATVSSG